MAGHHSSRGCLELPPCRSRNIPDSTMQQQSLTQLPRVTMQPRSATPSCSRPMPCIFLSSFFLCPPAIQQKAKHLAGCCFKFVFRWPLCLQFIVHFLSPVESSRDERQPAVQLACRSQHREAERRLHEDVRLSWWPLLPRIPSNEACGDRTCH